MDSRALASFGPERPSARVWPESVTASHAACQSAPNWWRGPHIPPDHQRPAVIFRSPLTAIGITAEVNGDVDSGLFAAWMTGTADSADGPGRAGPITVSRELARALAVIPDHDVMTVRPPNGVPLPDLVLVSNKVLNEEARALRAAMEQFGSTPQSGSPWAQDNQVFPDGGDSLARGRAALLRYSRHQASLIYVNAWDHLITLGRVLGGDGAMPLFSQASLSRVVCEGAVRFAWLMDPDVGSAERLVRGAVALHYSAEQRAKGVRALPAERFDSGTFQQLHDSCRKEHDDIQKLIEDAGLSFEHSPRDDAKVRLTLQSPSTSVPLKINVTQLMARWLSDSPSWYNIGSSVSHSIYWGLRDINHSRPGGPLALTPSVLDVGAAVESAISASALILAHGARMNGHDPAPHVRHSQQRREKVDALMRRAATSSWAHIPAG